MKTLSLSLILAAAAAAQTTSVVEQSAVEKMYIEKTLAVGKPVKGAPYSGTEVTESAQTLADGTRINHKNEVSVYRDGEGRVRRETPTEITISDPVAGVSYTLDPSTKTGRKSALGKFTLTYSSSGPVIQAKTFVVFRRNDDGSVVESAPVDPKSVPAALDKMTAEMKMAAAGAATVNGSSADQKAVQDAWQQLSQAKIRLDKASAGAKAESLGKQNFWGVEADGTRSTTTLEAGAIGNDRPINIVSERWYSADLQTLMMTKHTDPRTGEETFRLTNVRRGEPGSDLFMVPPGYAVK